MVRIKICIVLIFLLFGCSARMIHQISEIPTGEAAADRTPASAVKADHPSTSEKPPLTVPAPESSLKAAPVPSEKSEVSIPEETVISCKGTASESDLIFSGTVGDYKAGSEGSHPHRIISEEDIRSA